MSPSVLLFDLDGTLIDTYRLYIEAYSRAVEPYLGRRPTPEEFAVSGGMAERTFLVRMVGAEHVADCHDAMCRHYESLHAALVEGLYEGVREMLAALRSAGLVLGVVTGKGRRLWEVTRRSLDLGEFAVVVTEDDVAHPKPHPAGLAAALEALGTSPAEAVYIGDSPADLEAARAASMRAGAALWPKTAPGERESFLARIRPLRPDWSFEHPADVSRTFAAWC